MSSRNVMICVPTLVGWKKGTRTIHSYFRVIREAKKRRWVERGTTIRSCLAKLSVLLSTSCLPSLFQNFFNSWSLLYTHTHSCLFISFSLWHAWFLPRDITLFQMCPFLWYCKTVPLRECAILFMALIELIVHAYWNHCWYPSMVSVLWNF